MHLAVWLTGGWITGAPQMSAGDKRRGRDKRIDVRLGAKIRDRRQALGMTQIELGKRLGVTFQQIQKYETGTNAIASTRIAALCKALDIEPNDLFG